MSRRWIRCVECGKRENRSGDMRKRRRCAECGIKSGIAHNARLAAEAEARRASIAEGRQSVYSG